MHKFLLHHYVLMKNHIHLCITMTQDTDLAKMMQGLQLSYNYYLRNKRDYVGYLWQGRFNSKIIGDDLYLLTAGLYIERNPVKAGIVDNPEDYPWSSYRCYALGESDPLIDPSPLYNDLRKSTGGRQKEYRELMATKIKELYVPVTNVTSSAIMS